MYSLDPIELLAATLILGITAYLLRSRLLLAFALTAFAAWMSAEITFSFFFPFSRVHLQGTGWRFLGCAAVFVAWRWLQARYLPRRRDFNGVLEGFAAHLAGVGAVLLTLPGYFDRPLPTDTLTVGIAVLAVVVVLIGGIGWRRRQKSSSCWATRPQPPERRRCAGSAVLLPPRKDKTKRRTKPRNKRHARAV